jgi:hypothetical protein
LNLVKHVFVPIELIFLLPILFDKPIKPISILLIQITIPPETFKQHLLKTFFQLETKEMEIDKMLTWIKVQFFCIASWTITKEE